MNAVQKTLKLAVIERTYLRLMLQIDRKKRIGCDGQKGDFCRTCQKLSFREKLPEKLVESKGKNITYDRY